MMQPVDQQDPSSQIELKPQLDQLAAQIKELQAANDLLQRRNSELEERSKQSPARTDLGPSKAGSVEPGVEVTPITDADATLRRLVQRIAMILQAEKIVIMFYDPERGDLRGIPPAYGLDDAHLNAFHVRATMGVSGKVFRDSEPVIFHDSEKTPLAKEDPFGLLHVQNGLCVPLVIEKRDEENRVIDRNVIGVLHAFNKRHGEDFNDEDVRLLERMARNVGSIIANLQLYREVVEEREELLQTFESLSAGLVLVSMEGTISQVNASARTIFQAGPDVFGKPYAEMMPQPELAKVFDTALSGTEPPMAEVSVVLNNQERTYQVQAANVQNQEGKPFGVVAIFNDVTEIKNIEKMKSSFVAMASHELRTPLTAIKGFSSTLLEGIDDQIYGADEQKEFLQIVVSECDRLRRLIDDLLNTSRIEAGESLKPSYGDVDIKELLEKVVMIQKQATHKHNLRLDIQGELPSNIIGDRDKLDQILTNLMNNAIKYAPNGGDITLHAKRVENDELLIGVEDQGLGIPKDHLGKVFEKFHRVNNEDNRKIYGTGLGLFLVKHLVEGVHMGKIWVESEVGVGSTFWFRIPTALDIDKAKALND